VGAVVVHNQVHLLVGRKFLLKLIQESDERLAAVASLTGADNLAVENIECREQRGRAIPLIVVSLALGRIQIQARYIPHFVVEMRIPGEFEFLHPMRLHVVTLPDPVNDRSEIRRWLASIRTLQCVLPSPGRVLRVAQESFVPVPASALWPNASARELR
jgi:hypothetical protein